MQLPVTLTYLASLAKFHCQNPSSREILDPIKSLSVGITRNQTWERSQIIEIKIYTDVTAVKYIPKKYEVP